MNLWYLWRSFNIWDFLLMFIEIGFIALVIYRVLLLFRGTRAEQLLKGLVVLVLLAFLAERLHLTTIDWLLDQVGLMVVVALPVVFQPELRRALEQLGRGKFFAKPFTFLGVEDMSRLINELVRSVQILSQNKTGALIIIERETGLKDFIDTGVKLDGVISKELLMNIFSPRTPLHDGACIIRGDRILAAGCFLPLTDSPYLSKQLGTRHRAALGISEVSDAVAVVVSEETGTISVAKEGKLTRFLNEKGLKEKLEAFLLPKTWSGGASFKNWRFS